MTRPAFGVAIGVVGAAVLLAAAWVNYDLLVEAYGAGPPYYSRTTNMDKWTDPLVYLIPIDALVLVLFGIAARIAAANLRHRGK